MTEHFGTLSLFHFRMWIYFSFIKCCLHLISTKAAKLAISKKLSFGYSICIFLLCLSLTCSRNLPDDSTSTTLGSPAPVETNKYASVSFLIIDFTMTDAKIFQLKANRKGILHGREESFQYLWGLRGYSEAKEECTVCILLSNHIPHLQLFRIVMRFRVFFFRAHPTSFPFWETMRFFTFLSSTTHYSCIYLQDGLWWWWYIWRWGSRTIFQEGPSRYCE